MTRDEVFPSRYLKASDLKGKPVTVVIESAPYETLKSLDGKETQKNVLHFKGTEKTFPLNPTNWDLVAEATGCPDTDDWPGCRIELYPTKTAMGGKLVDCVRIRQPSVKPPGEKQAPATNVVREGLGRPTVDFDQSDAEEIPW